MTFKTLLSDINNVALAMESLKNITQFNTGSTIANGEMLSNVAIEQYKASIDGLSLSQAQAALSATALNDAQKQQILTSAGLLESTQAVTLEEVKQMASSATLSVQKKEEILTTLQGAYSEGQWNTERLEAIASGEGEAATIAQTILAKKAESAENVKNIAGRKALTASLKEELAARVALMASNPVTWIVGIAAVSVGLIALQEKFSKSLEECTEDLKNYNSEFENAQSSVESLESELDTCQTRLAELQKLADNGTLSIVEQEEYERLQKTNDELERNLKIEREKAQLNAIDGAKTADETVNKTVQSNYVRGDVDSYEGVVLHDQLLNVTPKEELEGAIAEYNRLQGEIDKLNKSYDDGSISSEDYTTQLNSFTDAQTKARTRASEMSDILIECEQSYNNLENTGGKFTTTSQQNYDSVKLANQEYSNFLDTINGVNDSFDKLDTGEKAQTLKNKYAQKTLQLENGQGSYTVEDKEISDWIDKLSDDDLSVLATINFSGEQTKESMQEALDYAKNHTDTSNETSASLDFTSFVEKADSKDTKTQNLAWLQTEADLLKTIQKEISETGRISVSSMQSMLKQFPEANEALSKYMVGLIDEQELFEELQSIYDDDAKAYAEKMYKELEVTDEFLDSVKKEYPELFDTLYNLYQDDLGNYTNLAELKKQIDVALVTALDKLWANHYQLIYDNASNAYSAIIDDQAMLDGTLSTEESENILNGISSEVDKANTALQELEKIKDSFVNKITSDSSWSSLGKDSSSKGSSSSKDTKKQFDWLERAIKKVQNAYSRLKNVVSDTTRSWSTRNNALIQSQQELTRQINLQSQAYEYYMQLFNALDLDDYYKKLIMDGAMLVETITDPDLLEVINKAIELFDKAEEAKNNVSSLTSELHELSTQLFDNTAKEFQGKINVYEHAMKTLENGVSLIETKGYKVTASLYEEMISETQDRIGLLQQERSALESAMASADVEVGSEAWMDMYNQILDVDNAIQEATISLAEFNNELRQLKWDKFDDIQSGIQETVDEAEFMYKLLENRGLTNDTGGLNDNGIAAQGLLAEKYNLYMAMADKYAKEVKSIDAELASDPGNTKLLERRQELLKAQRDAILNAEDEKESIKSLIEESYNKLGDTLSDLISKYKDFMKTIKDTYNYEKSMAEKTKQLADLQKQFNAVRNDNSEEGMSRRQQLEDQIKTSQDDIQQTEYEKLISDTEALLDKFSSEYEEWLTNLVTELETTLQMAIDQTNQYSDQILSTLNDQAYNVGYTLSDATTAVFDSIGDSVAMYGQGFLDSANGINSSIMLVENAVEAVYNAVQAQAIAQQAIAQAQSQIAGAMMGGGSSGSQSTSGDALSGSNDTGSGGGNSIGVGSIMTLKDGSEYWETSWGNGRSGSKYAGVQGGVIIDEMSIAGLVDGGQNDPNAYGDHYVHIRSADGVYRDLGWVRWEDLEEYGTGTRNAKNDLAWTQDGGSEIIRTADGAVLTPLGKGGMVFNNKSSNNLYDFGEDPKGFIEKLNLNNYIPNIPNINLPKLDTVNKSNGDVNMGGVSFNFGQIVANNPEEFATQLRKTMASNSMVQKMVQEVVLGQSLGHNSLNTKRYL